MIKNHLDLEKGTIPPCQDGILPNLRNSPNQSKANQRIVIPFLLSTVSYTTNIQKHLRGEITSIKRRSERRPTTHSVISGLSLTTSGLRRVKTPRPGETPKRRNNRMPAARHPANTG